MRFGAIAVFTLSLWIAAGTVLPAQINPDDLVVTGNSQTHLIRIDSSGAVSTFAVLGFRAQCITEDVHNRGFLVASDGLPGDLAHVAMDGTITTIVKGGPLVVDLDVDGEGNFLGAGFGSGGKAQNAVFTISPSGTIITLIQGGGGAPFGKIYAMAMDTQSGDVVVFDGAGYILRITRSAKSVVTTIVSSLSTGGSGGLHPLYGRRNQLIGVWNRNTIHSLVLGSSSPLTTIKSGAPFVWVSDVEYEPSTRLYAVADLSNTSGTIYRFDPVSGAITTIVNLNGIRPTQIAVAGGRHLCAVNAPQVGKTYQMLISMPQYVGASYVTALSFGYSPGFVLPGGVKVHLNPDTLFALSVSGLPMFSKFQGTLGNQGNAAPSVALPNIPGLVGLRFFAAAVAFNGGTPLRATEPLGFTVRP